MSDLKLMPVQVCNGDSAITNLNEVAAIFQEKE
jgi:hypothetical protein